jgi:putative addiction module CopG family antidote
MTLTISLPPRIQRFVDESLRTGRYSSAGELVADALETMMAAESLSPQEEEYVRRQVARGLAQAEAQQYSEFDAESVIADERAKAKR